LSPLVVNVTSIPIKTLTDMHMHRIHLLLWTGHDTTPFELENKGPEMITN
jgi:hypothetical protein